MLTPEREREIRSKLMASSEVFPDDRLSGATYGDFWDMLSEIDALRARVAALEEAGEGLVPLHERLGENVVARWDEPVPDEVARALEALARWREVVSSGAGDAVPPSASGRGGFGADDPPAAPETLAGVRLDAEPGGAYAPVDRGMPCE